ncbi:hypothetical protein SSX86_006975 [Deinandra increscens subsp. villosa]|uniref:Integrase catalytic domain-containing protein n=1 Tax=Deinandra increscens subsp. villosa TaxID=3103831 RepID=A0AAP0DKI0_9ASTR
MATSSTIITVTASTHFTIKLTHQNYPVWRRHVHSSLIGLDLAGFLTGDTPAPAKTKNSTTNPDYTLWVRQDQAIFSAMLGSCADEIQPLIASAATAKEAWDRLATSFANESRSRIVSLKTRLTTNSKGNRSITTYLNEMRKIADELALVQSPISDEDLMVYILSHLGDEYSAVTAALKVRDSPITYADLFEKLVDFERSLPTPEPVLPVPTTANVAQRFQNRNQSYRPPSDPSRSTRSSSFSTNRLPQAPTLLKDNNVSTQTEAFPPVANVATSQPTNNMWMMDSGASHHLATNTGSLASVSEYGGPDEILLGDGTGLKITHFGSTQFSNPVKPLSLPNVLCVPNLRSNLISVAQLCRTNNVSVEFFPLYFLVKDIVTGATLARGENINDVYYLKPASTLPNAQVATAVSPLQWHHRLGHPSFHVFQVLCKDLGLKFNKLSTSFHCSSCHMNKSHKLPFGPNSFVANNPLELIYSDVWGPVQQSIDGFKYYVIFVDYFSKYVWLYPLKKKSDVSVIFPQFKRLVEKFFSRSIVSFFSDNGGEYLSLSSFLKSEGISHFTTPPHTSEQNGIAERRHRHIVETGFALLHYAGLPITFWSYAFQTAVYIINRLPTPILHLKSPFHTLFRTPPNYNKLKTFGCLFYPWLKPYTTSKLQPKSQSCIFLGYSVSKSAYMCFEPKTQRMYHSQHVSFIETEFPSKGLLTSPSPLPSSDTFLNSTPTTTPTPPDPPFVSQPSAPLPTPSATLNGPGPGPHEPTSPLPTPSPSPPHTPSSPSSTPPPSTDPIQSHHSDSNPNSPPAQPVPLFPSPPSAPQPSFMASSSGSVPTPPPKRTRKTNPKYFNPNFVNNTTVHPIPPSLEPSTHTQALKDPLWRKAMDDEYNALLRNHTWELVAPTTRQPIGCKWIFRIKRHPDGSIEKYKARLVAKGFLQEYGKDYFDTFSPVTKPVKIRTVLAIALSKGWSSRQLDVNNAFLQGQLEEEVYMTQPPGYAHPQYPHHVCRLRRSLYGLKQAPRAWYLALTQFLLDFGFLKSHADASLFIYNRQGVHCYFLVYVDDIIVTSNSDAFIDQFVNRISSRFSLKDLGTPSHFLGVELIHTPQGLFLSQHRHIQDLLERHHMDGAKPVLTPLCSSQALTLDDGSATVDSTPYRQLVGSLQYLAFTRPDISFAVNRLSQFMHRSTQLHWSALKRLLRYLKGTVYHGLFLKKHSSLDLTAFSDSDWGGVNTTGRSTTAYVLYLGGNIISWKSARQKSVSRSSTEAEYKAIANAAAEIAWVENLLKELG